MANFRRSLPRHRTVNMSRETYWLNTWPASYDIIYHTRPSRRAMSRLLRCVVTGQVDPDAVAWPLSKRPHVYYW